MTTLTTTIGQQLQRADRTRNDLIDIVRSFVFCENLGALGIFELTPEDAFSYCDTILWLASRMPADVKHGLNPARLLLLFKNAHLSLSNVKDISDSRLNVAQVQAEKIQCRPMRPSWHRDWYDSTCLVRATAEASPDPRE